MGWCRGGKADGWARGWADGWADGKAGAGAGSHLLNTKASQVATSPAHNHNTRAVTGKTLTNKQMTILPVRISGQAKPLIRSV